MDAIAEKFNKAKKVLTAVPLVTEKPRSLDEIAAQADAKSKEHQAKNGDKPPIKSAKKVLNSLRLTKDATDRYNKERIELLTELSDKNKKASTF